MTAKTRAIPSFHRDSFAAKEPGPDSYRDCPVLAPGNTTSLYCRTAMRHVAHDSNLQTYDRLKRNKTW
jgi:hypothetical protein